MIVYTVQQAAILGCVQGLTEFLPVSSSAHLKLVPWLLQWQTPDNEQAFDVALHFGTLFAVLIYFFFDWLLIVASYIGDVRQGRWLGGRKGSLLLKIGLATIPGAITGKLFEKRIEELVYDDPRNIWILAVTMTIFAIALVISERIGKQDKELDQITYGQAFIIGCCQALALVPGVSRSGVTILAGLFLGLTRVSAARFSFLLATPLIAGACVLKGRQLHSSDWSAALYTGVATSAIVGVLTIRILMKYVQSHRYLIFAYYRWAVAALILGFYYHRSKTGQLVPPGTPASAPPAAAAALTRQDYQHQIRRESYT